MRPCDWYEPARSVKKLPCSVDAKAGVRRLPRIFAPHSDRYTGALLEPRRMIRAADHRPPARYFVRELDTCGLACPLPLLKAKQALNAMTSGEKLRVRATDRGSWRDFRAFAEQSGHTLLECSELEGVFVYVLQKR